MTGNARGALLGLVAFGLFAAHDAIIKGLGGSYAPFQIVFFSVLLSFPLSTLLLMRDPTEGNLIPRHPWWMAARTAAAVATGVGAFYAFTVLPLAQVYAILFAAPLLITVLSIPVLGETVRLRRWLAVVVGLVGVLIVLRPGGVVLGLGHAGALLAACSSAINAVIVRRIGREERPVVMLLYPLIANFVLMACLMPLVYRPMPFADLAALGAVAGLAFCAMLLTIAAYRAGDPSVVAPMQYSQIVWATLYGALFFGEVPDAMTALGAAVVIGSGLYILFREGRAGASDTTPNLSTRSRFDTGTTPRVGAVMRHRGDLPEPEGRAAGLDAVRRSSLRAPPGRGGLANLRRPE